MDGEVYNYGSFLQSKMYAAGVTCSNCHEPHSLKLRAEGNAVCAQCHQPSAFDTAAHHFHTPGEPGQPVRRLPHAGQDLHGRRPAPRSRLPRAASRPRQPGPASPDVCASCHEDKDPAWSAARIAEWYGPDRRREPMFGEALAADRAALPGAAQRLVKLADDPAAPAIARATAVAALEHRLDERTVAAVQRANPGRLAYEPLDGIARSAQVLGSNVDVLLGRSSPG